MSHIVQMSYSDLEKLFRKIAGQAPKPIGVSRSKVLEEMNMSDWQLREAVKQNPAIKIGSNRYNLSLLKQLA